MENFNWTTFTIRIPVKAPLQDLYTAWTTTSGIEKWFLSKAVFFDASGNAVDGNTPVAKGFTYEWSWYLYDQAERGRITEANGKNMLQFTFAGECLVDISLTQQGEYVIVELTQKDIPTDDASRQGIRLGCHKGWSFFLVNLKSVYEGGLDLRNKDISFTRMINN